MRDSCWARQDARRDSRGWADWRAVGEVDVEAFGAGWLRLRLERRVSCTPGAEGAPSWGVVVEGWEGAGTMRRDC